MASGLRHRWTVLLERLRAGGPLLVAYSGGCDSAFLCAAAREALGASGVLAVTAVSASLPEAEQEAAARWAYERGIPHAVLATRELDDPRYTANPANRCFYCKEELFSRLAPLAAERGMSLADGFNTSDRGDYRPGKDAADRRSVRHPLDEAGLSKRDIRVLSRWLGLSTWNKPAEPCLSSRIPYGTAVTPEILRRIERAEAVIHREGFRVVRVRHHGAEARVEVPAAEIARLRSRACWARVEAGVKAAGYARVSIEPEGFRSGRLNAGLKERAPFGAA